jgi:outer membrane lipoprotein SlyB
MKKYLFSLAFASTLIFSGCSGINGPSVSDTGSYSIDHTGVIIATQHIQLKDNGLGSVGGALVGGYAGNQLNQKEGMSLRIRLDNGEVVSTVTYKQFYHVGDKVHIKFNGSKITIY